MKNLGYKIASSIAIAGLLTSLTAGSAFAAKSIKIKNNGNNSYNKVKVVELSATIVGQSNNSTIVNGVTAKSDTGDNQANKNTGGDTSVDTGKATTTVGITVDGSSNEANLPDCGCPDDDLDVVVKGNGNGSTNKVKVFDADLTLVWQKNKSVVINDVYAKSDSGDNEANKNTGGNVDVTTGNAKTGVTINVTGSSNTLN